MKSEEKQKTVQELANDVERLKKVISRLEEMLSFFSMKEIEECEFLQDKLSSFVEDCSLQIKYDTALVQDLEKSLSYLNSVIK